MESIINNFRQASRFEKFYFAAVLIKGIDGLLELAAGLLLLVAPGTLHTVLKMMLGEAREHAGQLSQMVAIYIARTDGDLVRGGTFFLVVFLLSHGIIKIVLVYCLLRELVWAYPYAFAILGILLLYQVFAFIQSPSLWMGVFVVLDVIIMYLVWGEWQKLKVTKMLK